jgi:hypothetical protein
MPGDSLDIESGTYKWADFDPGRSKDVDLRNHKAAKSCIEGPSTFGIWASIFGIISIILFCGQLFLAYKEKNSLAKIFFSDKQDDEQIEEKIAENQKFLLYTKGNIGSQFFLCVGVLMMIIYTLSKEVHRDVLIAGFLIGIFSYALYHISFILIRKADVYVTSTTSDATVFHVGSEIVKGQPIQIGISNGQGINIAFYSIALLMFLFIVIVPSLGRGYVTPCWASHDRDGWPSSLKVEEDSTQRPVTCRCLKKNQEEADGTRPSCAIDRALVCRLRTN